MSHTHAACTDSVCAVKLLVYETLSYTIDGSVLMLKLGIQLLGSSAKSGTCCVWNLLLSSLAPYLGLSKKEANGSDSFAFKHLKSLIAP